MTEATGNHQNLPQAAKPSVFHHEGRRLFLIDGEPRIVDVDIAKGLGLIRDRKVRDLIARQIANLAFFDPVLKVDMANGDVQHVSGEGARALPHDGAMPSDVSDLLKAEGFFAPTGGRRPTIWFLTRDQMRWIVAKSETDKADEFLRELLQVYKAWEAGTLEPARPAVEPPRASEALPPPADPVVPPVALSFHGVAYELVGGDLHVVDESLYRAGGYSPAKMRSIFTDLPAVGAMPSASSLPGAFLLSVRHVDFLAAALRTGHEEQLAVGFVAVLQVLRAHAFGRVEVIGGTLMESMGPDGVSREYAAGRAGGPSVLGWAPAPFIRDAGRRLRVRHSQLAMAFGIGERMLLLEVNAHRRDLPGEIVERHERQHGLDVIGVYLDEAQCSMLGIAMGFEGDVVAERLFDERVALEADLHSRAMADLADLEARDAMDAKNPTVARSIVDLKNEVAALGPRLAEWREYAAEARAAADRIEAVADRPFGGLFRRSPRVSRKH